MLSTRVNRRAAARRIMRRTPAPRRAGGAHGGPALHRQPTKRVLQHRRVQELRSAAEREVVALAPTNANGDTTVQRLSRCIP